MKKEHNSLFIAKEVLTKSTKSAKYTKFLLIGD